MSSQIQLTCKTCYYYLHLIGRKGNFLCKSALIKSVEAFVFSRLNFCCTIYYNLPKDHIKKLQYVQNSAARLISGRRKNDHISDVIKSLNWLNVENFILFRNLCIVYKCLCDIVPKYLLDNISLEDTSLYNLRSSTEIRLNVNRSNT